MFDGCCTLWLFYVCTILSSKSNQGGFDQLTHEICHENYCCQSMLCKLILHELFIHRFSYRTQIARNFIKNSTSNFNWNFNKLTADDSWTKYNLNNNSQRHGRFDAKRFLTTLAHDDRLRRTEVSKTENNVKSWAERMFFSASESARTLQIFDWERRARLLVIYFSPDVVRSVELNVGEFSSSLTSDFDRWGSMSAGA